MSRPTPYTAIPLFIVLGCRPPAPATSEVPTTEPTTTTEPAVAELIESIDPSVDPCTSFYDYACGHASSHGAEGATSIIDGMFYAFDDDVWRWMRAEPEGEGPTSEIRRYLAACRDPASDQGAAVATLLGQIDELDGAAGFLHMAGVLQRHGIASVLKLRQEPRTHAFVPLLEAWGSTTPSDALHADRDAQAHADHVAQVTARLQPAGGTEALARKVVAFEARLRALWNGERELIEPSAFVQAKAAWAPYVEALGLPPQTSMVIGRGDFTDRLPRLLVKTRPDVLRGYLKWMLLDELASDLPSTWALPGDVADERSVPCSTQAYALFEWHLLEAYGSQDSGSEVRAEAIALFEEVRTELVDSTRARGWLSEPAREAMATIQLGTRLRIGWPDEPWGTLPTMDPTAHAANVLALQAFRFEQLASAEFGFEHGMLGGRPIRPNNAWNDYTLHGIDVGLAMLQAPVFDPARPRWMNLASLGMIAGHELSHSYNPDGLVELMKHEGLDPALADGAIEYDRCMKEAYETERPALAQALQDIDPGYPRWFDETAADISGLQRAYALFEAERDAGRVVVPQDVSADALYFVGYAQYFCDWTESESPKSSRARINAAVAGVPRFAEIFECSPDDAAVLEHTCGAW